MSELFSLFDYIFFRNAVFAIILTGILAAMIGTYIVSRKIVFISGGITHASFGGIGIAYYFGLNPFLGAAVFSILSAIGVEWATGRGKIREDSAIAILWSFGMAVGIIFVFLTPGYTPNLMTFLFGNILSVDVASLWTVAAFTAVTALFMTVYYRPVVYSAFDPEFSKTMGVHVSFFRYAMSVLIACSIVISIHTMGIILVLSFFTIPQSTAMLFTKEFPKIIFLSIIFGIAGSLLGLFSSYAVNIPSGASVIFGLTVIYLFFKGAVAIRRLFLQKNIYSNKIEL